VDPKLITARRAIVRVSAGGRVRYGLFGGGRIRLYEGSPFAGGRPGKSWLPVSEAKLLAPCRPSKIVCVGRNYSAHAKELGNPVPDESPIIFLKPSTSVIGPGRPIRRPAGAERVDHESELAVVIGRPCRRARRERALDYVLGYTCLNDVTERTLQKADGQWTRAKGFDTFCPLGPAIALDAEPQALTVRCLVDGELRQEGHTGDMIFPVDRLIEFISGVMTLNPGDVIATGTPEGVGPLTAGQEVAVEVEGVGRLANPVRDAG
jgi:2-keto-4-pentenoate hydratase/2-oxohepta-3-ene-1,7-dioic acid hydratase in catechol pathway